MAWSAAIPILGDLLEKLIPDREAQAAAKLKLLELQQRGELDGLATRAEVVRAEIGGESWLQRNWRPVLMLTIVAIVANNYLLYPYLLLFSPGAAVQLELPEPLWSLMNIGVGGYVIGRTAEKGIKTWKGEVPK